MIANEVLIHLVKGCQQGDEKAQSTFYNHYKKRLLGICLRYARTTFEAEDIFQEAFIKVFQKINEVKHPEAVHFWIKSVVVRTAIDHYRKNKAFGLTIDADQPDVLPDHADAFDVLDQLEKEEILAAITALPDGYRMVVNLYLIDGYEHHEIAEMMGISIGTSKSQLSRAKAYLSNILIEKGMTTYEKG
jgi:RNA polymerase sigma-70 factor (ECF subfamily)